MKVPIPRDTSNKLIRMVGAHNDLTNLKKVEAALKSRNEELKILVHDDSLTSLFNHHSVQEHFESQMRIAGRRKSTLSLLIVDVVHFKQINGRFDHLKGDETVKSVTKIIRNTARDSEIAARFDGEEFVVLFIDTNDEGSINPGERFRSAIEDHLCDSAVTVSVGMAS